MTDDDMKSTRVSERTTDRAPPPVPSVPPHVASCELGQMLMALDVIAGNIGGSLRGDVAELANKLGTQVRTQQAAFETHVKGELAELKLGQARILAAIDIAMGTFKAQSAELGHVRAENERILTLVPPPSSKHPTREPEALEG
jgi:hypothetical protein